MTHWLITNAELVNERCRFHADRRLRIGRIQRIEPQLNVQVVERISDAKGTG